MDWSFVESLKPDESYVRRLHPRLWLMDSHKWALFAWESSLRPLLGHERGILANLDYHLDACNDFTSAPDVERLLRAPGAPRAADRLPRQAHSPGEHAGCGPTRRAMRRPEARKKWWRKEQNRPGMRPRASFRHRSKAIPAAN